MVGVMCVYPVKPEELSIFVSGPICSLDVELRHFSEKYVKV
jgi:hypothetical protein